MSDTNWREADEETHRLTDTDRAIGQYETAAEYWRWYVTEYLALDNLQGGGQDDWEREMWADWAKQCPGGEHPMYDIERAEDLITGLGGLDKARRYKERCEQAMTACLDYETSWRAALAAWRERDFVGTITALEEMAASEVELGGQTADDLADDLLEPVE